MTTKQLTLRSLPPYNHDNPSEVTWDSVRRIIDSAYPDVLSNGEILEELDVTDILTQDVSYLTNLMWKAGLLHKYRSGQAVYYKWRRH